MENKSKAGVDIATNSSLSNAFKEILMNTKLYEDNKVKNGTKEKGISHKMNEILKQNCEELRRDIIDFQLFGKSPESQIHADKIPDKINIIIFGPSGSGKSSLIK